MTIIRTEYIVNRFLRGEVARHAHPYTIGNKENNHQALLALNTTSDTYRGSNESLSINNVLRSFLNPDRVE